MNKVEKEYFVFRLFSGVDGFEIKGHDGKTYCLAHLDIIAETPEEAKNAGRAILGPDDGIKAVYICDEVELIRKH